MTKPVKYIMMKDAKKPPTLANPLAEPSLSFGTKSLVKSNATIDAGPPIEITRKQINNSQDGDFPGIRSMTSQANTVNPTVTYTKRVLK